MYCSSAALKSPFSSNSAASRLCVSCTCSEWYRSISAIISSSRPAFLYIATARLVSPMCTYSSSASFRFP
ncbi:hypothetical protein QR680_017170 [Steinernema hermaphroditum]|uniref:Uncharacterized protein n=1 Tax=Steinernema hermaphroditum TaxID=289476 RepID=A0AA39HER2_9BILA|nr:hypothetical protein QR680_017170 [Steinernema hermaphroditum]